MVERPLGSQFGAGCGKLVVLCCLMTYLGQAKAHAGFNWVSDWSVASLSNVDLSPAVLSPPNPDYPDFVTISGSALYVASNPQQSFQTASIAERQFQLTGFAEPVRVTIQAVLDGWITFNRWGMKAELIGSNGVGNDVQSLQRYQLLPGTNHVRITQTREILLTNGIHSLTADIAPTIGPNFMAAYDAYGYVDAQLQIGIYAINGILLVPEPSSYIASCSGMIVLLAYRWRSRRKSVSA